MSPAGELERGRALCVAGDWLDWHDCLADAGAPAPKDLERLATTADMPGRLDEDLETMAAAHRPPRPVDELCRDGDRYTLRAAAHRFPAANAVVATRGTSRSTSSAARHAARARAHRLLKRSG